MARKLAANVHVGGRFFKAGDSPPDEFAEQITNPKAWGKSEPAPDADPDGPPPKTGQGSGVDKWKAFAESKGITVPEDAKRDDIVALVADAGIATE